MEMSTMPEKYFKATVRGQYYCVQTASTTQSVKNYEVDFILPSQEAALSTICKYLLDRKLKDTYPDYAKFRTHQLVNLELHNHKPDQAVLQMAIEDMSLAQLFDFTVLKKISVDPYRQKGTLPEIRALITSAYSNQKASQKENLSPAEQKEAKELDAILKANKISKDPAGMPISVAPVVGVKNNNAARPSAPAEIAPENEDAGPLPGFVEDGVKPNGNVDQELFT